MIGLHYSGKRDEKEIWDSIPPIELEVLSNPDSPNLLIQAENLSALKYLLEHEHLSEKVDLIYIDPPFATKQVFLWSPERANAVSSLSQGKIAYTDLLTGPAYLEFLRERIILLKALLSERGSIYVHVNVKMSHYVKVILDEIFGPENFRSDITRIKCNPKNFSRRNYGNIKDTILFYTKSNNYIWNEPYLPYAEEEKVKLFPKVDAAGRRYATVPLHAPGETQEGTTAERFAGLLPPPGRHWRCDVKQLDQWNAMGLIEWSPAGVPRKKIYLDEKPGKRVQDIWEFKDPPHPTYPTEKNTKLLELIIQTSSEPGSLVLDCFAGSGTTLRAAQSLGRHWIGIDKSEEAIALCVQKLRNLPSSLFSGPATFRWLRAAP